MYEWMNEMKIDMQRMWTWHGLLIPFHIGLPADGALSVCFYVCASVSVSVSVSGCGAAKKASRQVENVRTTGRHAVASYLKINSSVNTARSASVRLPTHLRCCRRHRSRVTSVSICVTPLSLSIFFTFLYCRYCGLFQRFCLHLLWCALLSLLF